MKKFLSIFILLFVATPSYAFSNKETDKMYTLINQIRLKDSFIRYAKIDTGSDPVVAEKQIPSTEKQIKLAKLLADELKEIGLKNVNIDKHSVVTANLPANDTNMPIIALFAHMDTSHDVPTGPVCPQIHKYDKNEDIVLTENVVIKADDLKSEIGNTIITSDGTTLLGADDKAGIAEIMEALKVLVENPSIKRPEIKIVFTPDEETGLGISIFDVENFDADVAYTVDGGAPYELDTETFNAFNPQITIVGKVVHCGYAYKKMINSLEVANEFISKLPVNETPSTTRGKEGYYFVDEVNGTAEKTVIKMLVRDFDLNSANERINFIRKILAELERKYGGCNITFEPKQRYLNMKENLNKFPEVISFAEEGIKRSGLIPIQNSVRGGTDGSALTQRGLLTPNLGAGGMNFHSQTEFVSVETMAKCTENIINILSVWAENAPQVMPIINERRK